MNEREYRCGCYNDGDCSLTEEEANCQGWYKCHNGGKPLMLIDIESYIEEA